MHRRFISHTPQFNFFFEQLNLARDFLLDLLDLLLDLLDPRVEFRLEALRSDLRLDRRLLYQLNPLLDLLNEFFHNRFSFATFVIFGQ